jgi:hypothetical protein
MKKTAAVLSALALTFSLAACGNGDDDTAKENIKAELTKDKDSLGVKATEEEADCLAGGMVDELGVEKLQKYKFLNEDLEVSQSAGASRCRRRTPRRSRASTPTASTWPSC